jgi:hypothetical protein
MNVNGIMYERFLNDKAVSIVTILLDDSEDDEVVIYECFVGKVGRPCYPRGRFKGVPVIEAVDRYLEQLNPKVVEIKSRIK